MKRTISFILVFALFLAPVSASLVFAAQEGPECEYGGAVPEEQREPQMQWVWGRALSVNAEAGVFTMSYLDYITDQNKELIIIVDDKTAYENIESISGIKASDTLSVDYIIDAAGRNIAGNVSVDKPAAVSP